jgi:hypothetical protein
MVSGGVAAAANGLSSQVTVTLAAGTATGTNATDPNFANVSLLLHMNGSNGSTTFTDSSSNNISVQQFGDAKISTASSVFGGASGLFDLSPGGYLKASNASLQFGTGDFTIEFWLMRLWTQQTNYRIIDNRATGNTTNAFQIDVDSLLGVRFLQGSNIVISNGASFPASQWIHIAIARSSGQTKAFRAGAQVGSTLTDTMNYSNQDLFIATGYTAATYAWCRIDELRVTKGVARYTANFTVPTSAFPDS